MSGLLLLAQETTETPTPAAPAGAEAVGGETTTGETGLTAPETGTKTSEPVTSKDDGTGAEAERGPFGSMSTILLMGVMLVFVYLIMFRPQKKQEQKRREMLNAMKKNDHVVTLGGIHGVIYSLTDSDVVLKIDERNDVRIRVAKTHVGRVVADDENQDSKEA